MKLCFQRSVYALLATENQQPRPNYWSRGHIRKGGGSLERWAMLMIPGSGLKNQTHPSVLHRGTSPQPCPSTKQRTPWKSGLLRVRVLLAQPLKRNPKGSWTSFTQKQGGRAPVPLLHHIETTAWEQSPPRQPKVSSSLPWAEDAFSAHLSTLGLPFWETLVDKELGLESISPVAPGGYPYVENG